MLHSGLPMTGVQLFQKKAKDNNNDRDGDKKKRHVSSTVDGQ